MSTKSFTWYPLGGLGEVGMNTMVFRFGDLCVPVDSGILFAGANDFGIEAIHPDYDELLKKDRPPIWLITHGHEDHIGAVPAIFEAVSRLGLTPPKVYAPGLAAGLIRHRIKDDLRYPGAAKFLDSIVEVVDGEKICIQDLEITYLPTRHSTLDTYSLAFCWKNPGSPPLKVIHTSDFKLDDTKYEDGVWSAESIYGHFQPEATDILFIDSTNAERSGGSVPEQQILENIGRVLKQAKGRVFVTLFSSNVQRIAAIAKLAESFGRSTALAGRALNQTKRIAQDKGYFGTRCSELPQAGFFELRELAHLAPEKQLILCSGSQGEGRSALMRMADGNHPDFDLGPGDTILFSSKTIPGNEMGVSRLINGLLRRGAEVLWEDTAKEIAGGPVHASGHARQEDIAKVIQITRPRYMVPVHGELRQLKACAQIGKKSGYLNDQTVFVVEDGTKLSWVVRDDEWSFSGREQSGEFAKKKLRFEHFVALSREPFLFDRKRMALGGVVSVALSPGGRAQIQMKGVFPESSSSKWIQDVHDEILGFVRNYARKMRDRDFRHPNSSLIQEIEEGVLRAVRRSTGLKPLCVVSILGSELDV